MPDYICSTCNNTFDKKSNYERHINRKTPCKPRANNETDANSECSSISNSSNVSNAKMDMMLELLQNIKNENALLKSTVEGLTLTIQNMNTQLITNTIEMNNLKSQLSAYQTQPVQFQLPNNYTSPIQTNYYQEPSPVPSPKPKAVKPRGRPSKTEQVVNNIIETTDASKIIKVNSPKMDELIYKLPFFKKYSLYSNGYSPKQLKMQYILANIDDIGFYGSSTLTLYQLSIKKIFQMMNEDEAPFRFIGSGQNLKIMIFNDSDCWVDCNKREFIDKIIKPMVAKISGALYASISNTGNTNNFSPNEFRNAYKGISTQTLNDYNGSSNGVKQELLVLCSNPNIATDMAEQEMADKFNKNIMLSLCKMDD